MALPILDGNQSATTLSTIFTAGAHIPAHTVVSLGPQAISDIGSAVSGISVSIGGTQSVTGSVSVLNFPATQTIAGTVTANGGNFLNSDNALITKDSATNVILLGGLAYSATPTLSAIQALRTQGAGTLRVYQEETNWTDTNQGDQPRRASQQTPFPVQVLGGSVTIGSLPAISGTVTANVSSIFGETDQSQFAFNFGDNFAQGVANFGSLAVSQQGPIAGTVTVGNSVTIGSLPAISGTVTANASNGSLTTRFGTPTTANVSFATSAVTNANRKYLLIQNVTTGSNVITVGIGFTPTTTQGIQLTAGAGITFESSYIPTGAVYVLSSVTASNFTILEA